MEFLLTTSAGLEAIAKNEIIKQGWTITTVKDRLVFFEWDIELMIRMNLWSRVWNKVYIVLAKKNYVYNSIRLLKCGSYCKESSQKIRRLWRKWKYF